MRIINLVDFVAPINTGIWKAAISTADILQEKYGVASEIWFPDTQYKKQNFGTATPIILEGISSAELQKQIQARELNSQEDIIISHGAWQYPTHWAHQLKRKGFRWVYTPHGMLEPWSMSQKWFKKWLYFKIYEGRFARKADAVRAVGRPELENLRKEFSKSILIPNGVPITEIINYQKADIPRKMLFMGRLHHKKGVIPLAEAWSKSNLAKNHDFELIFAGPDEGELEQLKAIISTQTNISYIGAVFGEAKTQLLSKCHYFALPSFSEGFPTSVVEAMQFGILPLISDGCNFPEAIEADVAIRISPNVNDIVAALNELPAITPDLHLAITNKCQKLILEHYSLARIAQQQFELYSKLLEK